MEGYEAAQEVPSDTLRSTGIGLLCGAAVVVVLWIVTKAGVWLLCPAEMYFEPNDDDSDWEEQVDDWIVAEQHPRRVRTRRYFERQFVRSKQWMQGSPLPRAYSPQPHDAFGDKLDEYYGNRRDGLEMVKKNKNEMDDIHVKEDEVPDYWRQWNEEKQTAPLPS